MLRKPEVVEETDESGQLGVEKEQTGEEDIQDPWDPKLIRVDPKTLSIRHILDMIDEGDLELAPDFQRRKVWRQTQRSRLIESILLSIPLPAFYFSEDSEGKLKVVDGLQRLSAIHDFVRGGKHNDSSYSLSDLEYLKELIGKRYEDIDGSLWARRIDMTQLSINVINLSTPTPVQFNIFKRINTGGSPLNDQEIRHCMSKQRSRDFLKKLTDIEIFNKATNYQLKNHTRMLDLEIVLRFCAYRLLYTEKLSEQLELNHASPDTSLEGYTPRIGTFLDNTNKRIAGLADEELAKLERDFEIAMKNAFGLFGEYAFRKWPTGSNKVNPINRALFEVWSVILVDYKWDSLEAHKNMIVKEFRDMMNKDDDFIVAISSATGRRNSVKTRYMKIKGILNGVGS